MESERRPDERPTEVVAANEAHERINLLIDRLTALTTERDAWRKQATADGARCQKLHAEVADLREALKTVPVADFVQRSTETPDSVAALKRDLAQALARAEGAERAAAAARMQRDTYLARLTRERDELLEQIENHVKAYELVQRERDEARNDLKRAMSSRQGAQDEHVKQAFAKRDEARRQLAEAQQRASYYEQLNVRERVSREAYEVASAERDEARKQVSALTDELERSAGTTRINELRHELIVEDRKFTALEELHRATQAERDEEREHRILNEQWALREQARVHHYRRLYGRARVAWQLVVDARGGLAALLDGIDAADETFDSDINADQEG
jgi:hypothetical protein